jgi:hypothetical protein
MPSSYRERVTDSLLFDGLQWMNREAHGGQIKKAASPVALVFRLFFLTCQPSRCQRGRRSRGAARRADENAASP